MIYKKWIFFSKKSLGRILCNWWRGTIFSSPKLTEELSRVDLQYHPKQYREREITADLFVKCKQRRNLHNENFTGEQM